MPSKLGPHSLNAHGDAVRMVRAGAPVAKLVDFFGPAAELLAIDPALVLVGRQTDQYDPNARAREGASAAAEARAYVERQAERFDLNPAIRLWEGPNEPALGNADDPANLAATAWYAAFEAERLRLLAERGLRGVVGNFATGNPDLGLWPAFLPAVQAAAEFGGYLGLHEYSSPWMWWLTGDYQTGNCDPTPNFAGEADTGWLTLRYRKVYREHLEPAGLGAVPLLITECGLDSVGPVCPNYTSGPWKSHPDFWRSQSGDRDPIDYWRASGEHDADRYYARQLMWYDRELQRDAYVVGATLFTVGQVSGWEGFDVAGTRVVDELVAYLEAERAAAPPPEPRRPAPSPDARPAGEPAGPESPGQTTHTTHLPFISKGKD